MPVITVVAAIDSPISSAVLSSVNVAACTALHLSAEAVHSILVPALSAYTGTESSAPWPTAILHGRRRDHVEMQAATQAVAGVLASAYEVPRENTWVQWAVTE